ncbi:MAG TPA: hypothetical protein VGL16_13150 [Actinomycetota bacterium]
MDRDRGYGDGATATPNGNVTHPNALFVKVKTNPRDKRVHVIWNVQCYSGEGFGSSSGDFYRRTTAYKRVRMPFDNPGTCGFYATVELTSGSANLTAVLLARIQPLAVVEQMERRFIGRRVRSR